MTGLNIKYTDTDDNRFREIDVPNGTKKLKKYFKALIDSYIEFNKAYKLNGAF